MSDQLDFEKLYGDDKVAHGVPEATPWDIGGAQPFVQQLVALDVIRGDVLDPGTGPGHNSIYLASHGYSATGIDGSASAIERAKANAEAAGVSPTFLVGDATTLDGFDAAFDTVIDSAFFHTLFGDQDAQVRYLDSLHRATRPGARLYMYEFGCHNVNGIVSPTGIPEATFRTLLPRAGWQITYLGTNTYIGTVSVTAMEQLDAGDEANEMFARMLAPLRAVEPFLVDGRVHYPFWEVHATRVD
ncbi:class I SAM-dependent methyltransferase [Mycobacteroides abscessus]